jgi:hypothetical protein
MTTLPVHIRGTPMTFAIPVNRISLTRKTGYYVPGNIIHHDALGNIRCEEIQFGNDFQPARVICSIVDHKDNLVNRSANSCPIK